MGNVIFIMRIIQSFWSKPFLSHLNENTLADRSNGGYKSSIQFWMSFIYSFLTIRRFYPEIELFTDTFGKKILIDNFKLPYNNINTCLDDIDNYDPGLWAIGKIYTYSLQNRPFLHIDNDVFIWKKFDENWLQFPLLAQSEEGREAEDYHKICKMVQKKLFYVPHFMNRYINNKGLINNISAYNAGVLGGNNMPFFRKYCDHAFKLVDKNLKYLNKIDKGLFNIFYEQSLFYCLAIEENIKVEPLLTQEAIFNNYKSVIEFDLIPQRWYIHTVGDTKKYDIINEQIYIRLYKDFPEFFARILNFFNNAKL